ncbi:alginate lyase family protein [Daejeonella lutea]|nr:alginate lyase family protein [Daejeonella lutea]
MNRTVSFTSLIVLLLISAGCTVGKRDRSSWVQNAETVLKDQVLKQAQWALGQKPLTVTAAFSARSAGGKHDFYSEGDYWWPNPANPSGPYIQRDGLSNPDNFSDHRLAMIRFGTIIGSLASAYKITGDEKYARHAVVHLKAWFLDTDTRMNPNLNYAQAIKGVTTGRGVGIIDTVHLMEVAQGALVLRSAIDKTVYSAIQHWFSEYIVWLTTSKNGLDEKQAKNNHATCWVMQVASFAKFTANEQVMADCRERYKTVLLPNQMAADGSFPLELARTKPYGYSIFNLDAMAAICQILSVDSDKLWTYETTDGRSIKKGIEYLYPYLKNKAAWPFKQDVMYWNSWPVAQPALLFGARAFANADWFNTWKNLDHNPTEAEVVRNMPIRNPLIWF